MISKAMQKVGANTSASIWTEVQGMNSVWSDLCEQCQLGNAGSQVVNCRSCVARYTRLQHIIDTSLKVITPILQVLAHTLVGSTPH